MRIVHMKLSRAPCWRWPTITALAFAGVAVLAAASFAAPRVSVSNPMVKEGRSGTSELVFTLSLTDEAQPGFSRRALENPIVVEWQTADLTAQSLLSDYVPASGSAWFHVIPASEEVRIAVYGDRLFEFDETVALDLVSANGASILKYRGIGTILNDETAPSVSIADATVIEGNLGPIAATFLVTLSEVSGADTDVEFATVDGTARSVDGDYEAVAGHLIIPSGSLSQRIVVQASGEMLYEPAEFFSVSLDHATGANIERRLGLGMIHNDDAPLGPNQVSNSTFLTDHAGWMTMGNCTVTCKPEGVASSGPHSAELLSTLVAGGVGAADMPGWARFTPAVGDVYGSEIVIDPKLSGTWPRAGRTHDGLEFGIDDSPNWVHSTLAAGTRYRVTAWVLGDNAHGAAQVWVSERAGRRTVRATESKAIELTSQWQKVMFDVVSVDAGSELDLQVVNHPSAIGEGFHVDELAIQQMLPGDIPPELALCATTSIMPLVPIALDVVVSDLDAQNIDALTADLSDFPQANLPTFVANATNAGGRLTWTPRANDLRTAPYQVRFIASNTSAVAEVASIRVVETPVNLARNGEFESHLGGWHPFGATMYRVAGSMQGAWAAEITREARYRRADMTADAHRPAEFGLESFPAVIATVASAGARYDVSTWVRSTSDRGKAYVRVTEKLGSQVVVETISPQITLGSEWTLLTVQHVAREAGSSLNLKIVNVPELRRTQLDHPAPSAFQVDGVMVLLAGQSGLGGSDDNGDRDKLPLVGKSPKAMDTAVQPNPVRDAAVLSVTLANPGPLHVALYDIRGRQVGAPATGETYATGVHTFAMGGRAAAIQLGKGVYFYLIRSDAGEERGRFVVLE